MKIQEIIQEAPIRDYETFSDTPKSKGSPDDISNSPEDFVARSSSFTHAKDRKLLTKPNQIKKIKDSFLKTEQDFNLYFVNSKEARQHTEVGEVSREWLQKNMPQIESRIPEDIYGITIIFTNNKGDARIAMTPWIIAHRIGHALARYSYNRGLRRQMIGYEQIDNMVKDMVEYMSHFYNLSTELQKRKFFQEIGTFRSAREKNLRQDFEFINELIAQYIITGKIKFNKPPRNRIFYFRGNKEDYEEAVQYTEMYERDLAYLIDILLDEALGRIFVM